MYDRIIAAATSAVWLMTKTKLEEIWTFLDAAQAGVQMDGQTWQVLAAANRERAKVRNQSAIGVIPIIGTIAQRVGLMEEASGGISTTAIGQAFDQMLAMDDVGSIVLEFDSGGGTYQGVPELTEKIYNARGAKPIIAHINSEAGSGALWLASAAGEVIVTPSGSAGSVGAYTVHDDESALNEAVGVKRRYISYGEYKTEGNRDEPLADETAAYMQERINRVGQEFETALAKYRGVSVKHVQQNFGRGRMLDAKAAKAVGMVDRIATFDETLARVSTGNRRGKARVENAKKLLRL